MTTDAQRVAKELRAFAQSRLRVRLNEAAIAEKCPPIVRLTIIVHSHSRKGFFELYHEEELYEIRISSAFCAKLPMSAQSFEVARVAT